MFFLGLGDLYSYVWGKGGIGFYWFGEYVVCFGGFEVDVFFVVVYKFYVVNYYFVIDGKVECVGFDYLFCVLFVFGIRGIVYEVELC